MLRRRQKANVVVLGLRTLRRDKVAQIDHFEQLVLGHPCQRVASQAKLDRAARQCSAAGRVIGIPLQANVRSCHGLLPGVAARKALGVE